MEPPPATGHGSFHRLESPPNSRETGFPSRLYPTRIFRSRGDPTFEILGSAISAVGRRDLTQAARSISRSGAVKGASEASSSRRRFIAVLASSRRDFKTKENSDRAEGRELPLGLIPILPNFKAATVP